MAIGMLFIIGRDACHNAYTASTQANQLIRRLTFLPALHSFSLWDLAHNRTHHRFNNIRGIDYVWEPMIPDAYRGAPWPQRVMYRFRRTPGGVPLYNLPRMQRALEVQGNLVTWRFTWRAYARVCRRCKLYDYDAGKWAAFDERP